ncbi:MAG: exodeoxyribonuclease VII small subunit [Saprospiraceae bacterium]|nr:exodeoxyribonuclease VII small subunit [Saprospiraceae bacterium]MCF8249343.1 exodeoxyribonuclease VII small subunit [Saprospiraceae bacterium]MCF8311380.1 exodeoxyribonuclease VII small subunit [Saprospiraceae bacterium]MCF8439962.1 exodeoxyribonuclease VII small subunit [Saprospiraceae bacterium]
MTKQKSKLTYESALQELQEIVSNLQEAAISIVDLSERVTRAAELLKFCREKLRETEEKVQGLFD